MKIGIYIACAHCGRQKCPRGRSAPAVMVMCDGSGRCPGYDREPHVGDLWPGETELDFGYPVRSQGTKELQP
jgi:hypothetical protein